MKFEWDPKKANANLAKHGVGFETAQKALADRYRMDFPQRVRGEDRWLAIAAEGNHVYVIVYIERGEKIRIISARKAEKHEKSIYRRQAF